MRNQNTDIRRQARKSMLRQAIFFYIIKITVNMCNGICAEHTFHYIYEIPLVHLSLLIQNEKAALK